MSLIRGLFHQLPITYLHIKARTMSLPQTSNVLGEFSCRIFIKRFKYWHRCWYLLFMSFAFALFCLPKRDEVNKIFTQISCYSLGTLITVDEVLRKLQLMVKSCLENPHKSIRTRWCAFPWRVEDLLILAMINSSTVDAVPDFGVHNKLFVFVSQQVL